jgi:hypothetical protein
LAIGTEANRRPFTMIEGFSRNEDTKKRSLSKPVIQRFKPLSQRFSRSGSSHSQVSREGDSGWKLNPISKRKMN